jgi:hypothetical protein
MEPAAQAGGGCARHARPVEAFAVTRHRRFHPQQRSPSVEHGKIAFAMLHANLTVPSGTGGLIAQ